MSDSSTTSSVNPVGAGDDKAANALSPHLSGTYKINGQTTLATILRQSLLMFLVLSVVTGCIYPAIVTILAQSIWADKANGSLIKKGDKVVGSELIGQDFSSPAYFWARISNTSPPYNAAASSGSNLGPTNPALLKQIKDRSSALQALDPGLKSAVPIDLVTSSGSGLDPDISLEAARYQLARVAKARGTSSTEVEKLIQKAYQPRQFRILGDPRVNVLKLNLYLDEQYSVKPNPTEGGK